MPKRSAGLLLYRDGQRGTEVLLVHPGGPFWARKDEGAWSIPKGEIDDGEEPREAAFREFAEETGIPPPADGAVHDLGQAKQKSGKLVRAFATVGDLDPSRVSSNTVEIAWPPRSGRTLLMPEIDRAEWFTLAEARTKILAGQAVFLDRLAGLLTSQG